MSGRSKNHTLKGGTSSYSLCTGAPPPGITPSLKEAVPCFANCRGWKLSLSERKKLRTERSIGYCGKRSILEEFDKNKSGRSVPTESLVEPNDKTQPSLCVVGLFDPAQTGYLVYR